jgi:hypothetical protein
MRRGAQAGRWTVEAVLTVPESVFLVRRALRELQVSKKEDPFAAREALPPSEREGPRRGCRAVGEALQRYAVTLDHPASCSIDASLEELRKKIRNPAKCALPKSKAAYSNVIATRYKLSRYQTAMGSEGLY